MLSRGVSLHSVEPPGNHPAVQVQLKLHLSKRTLVILEQILVRKEKADNSTAILYMHSTKKLIKDKLAIYVEDYFFACPHRAHRRVYKLSDSACTLNLFCIRIR